jgi:hypothetical protein
MASSTVWKSGMSLVPRKTPSQAMTTWREGGRREDRGQDETSRRGGRGGEGNEGGRKGGRADTYFALCVAQAIGQGLLGKAGEHDRVDSANSREGRSERGKEKEYIS